jgi:hypothetical protein
LVAGFSIGLLFLPVPAAMVVGLFLWRWKWAVAGLVAGALAGSLAFFLTVPLTQFEGTSVQGGVVTEFSGCGREILANLPSNECEAAERQAWVIAVAVALVVGVGTGLAVRVFARSR